MAARRLGTSTVHATRHSFARTLEQAGVNVSDSQARLGHSNPATMGRSLAVLNSAHSEHAGALAAAFGFGD
jgi:integrase